MQTSLTMRRLIRGLCLPLTFAAISPALPLRAQTETAPAPSTNPPSGEPDDAVKMEAISVTGTNIKRMDVEKVLPVTIFNQDSMDLRNAVTPIEMLTALPLVTNVPQNEATNGGAGARGDVSTVNIRGIGAGNTLVLLNGRRLSPHPITAGDGGQNAFSVNVNQLPTQGISHIDILRDGASSIYGTDAVAGVINYIMRQDFRGTELRTRWGIPENGGGQTLQGTLTFGTDFAGGKGRFLTTVDYLYRDAIYLRDRDFSAHANHATQAPAPFNVNGSVFDGTSGTGYYQSFRIGTATAPTYLRPVSGVLSFTSTAPSKAATPDYYLDINTYQMGSPRSTRVNWYNNIEYDLTSKITAFADISYYRAKSALVRQPIAMNAPTADLVKLVSVDNPYNPYGSRFYEINGLPNADGTARIAGTPQAITFLTGTLPGVDPEHIQVSSNVGRVVAGLRGKMFDTWSWESAILYSRAATTDLSRNGVRESFLAADLLKTDATAYNPFGYTFKVLNGAVVPDKAYTNPKSSMDFVQEWRHDGFSSIGSIDLRTSGELFNLWAGAVSLAFGGEFRKEEFVDKRPPYAGLNPIGSVLSRDDNDFVTASPKPDSAGDRKVVSAYAETVIPLVSAANNVPFVNSLEISSSARFERYSDFGNTTRPKVGFNWRPNKYVMIRASFNEGFSAPNLPTLYAPTQYTVDSQPGTVDLYRNPYTSEGAYVQRSYTTGNASLQPATSIGKSAGIVLEVPHVKGLTFTADYWQINQNNVINTLTAAQILTDDMLRLNAYTAAQLATGKTIDQIDLGSGTANYKGSPNIVREAVSAADQALFNAYNATHANAPAAVTGKIVSRNVKFENLADGYVSGWDFSGNYDLPRNEWGRFSISTDWTYLIRTYLKKNIPNQAPVLTERMNIDGTTRWRGTASLTWRKSNWSAGLSGYYTGRYTDSTGSTTAATYTSLGSPSYISKTLDGPTYLYRYVVHDTITYNTFVAYRFRDAESRLLKNSSIRLGVINVFDKAPPLVSGNQGYSASVYGSLLPGRTFSLDVTKPF